MPSKHSVIVSSEMTTFVGPGACDRLLLPPDALLIGFGDSRRAGGPHPGVSRTGK